MERSLALSLVIGATVGAGLGSAVGSTITQVGRLGKAVEDAEKQKAAALRETARLEQTTRHVQNYRTLGKEVLVAGQAHRAAQDRVRALARDIAASTQPTKAQEKALDAARLAVERTAAAQEIKKRKLASLRGELKAAGVDTRSLGQAERTLTAHLTAAKTEVDRTAQAVDRMSEAMARAEKRKAIGGEIRAQALKIGAAYFALSKTVKVEATLEHALRNFGNVAGLAGDQLDAVRSRLRGLSTDVYQSTSDLLRGVETMVGKGLDVEVALKAIEDVGRAATATGADIGDMANLSFTLLDNLHIPVDKLKQSLDSLAQAGKEGGFELKDMAREFPQLTAAAAALGLTGTEAVLSLGAALQVAMKGAADPSAAANNLSNFLAKVASPETAKNFEKMGIDIKQALADGVAAGENPIEVVMRELADATGNDLADAIEGAFDSNGRMIDGAAEQIAGRFKLGEIFGDRQVQDFLAPMLANWGDYLRIKKAAAGADGVVGKDFAAMSATFNEASNRLGLAWDKLMGSIGKSVLPVITPVINAIGHTINALADLADAAPVTTGVLISVVGGFMAFKTAMLAGRYAMTLYRGGLGGVVREMLGTGRASATATGGLGRVGAGSVGASGKLGMATLRLRQYAAAATSAARASSHLATSQRGIGGLGYLGGRGSGLFGKIGRSRFGKVGGLLEAGKGVLSKVGRSGIAKAGGKLLGKAAIPLAVGLDALNLASAASEGDTKGIGGSVGSIGGTLAGAAAGAAIGSVVPVIGTAIGGLLGGIAGSFGGESLGRWVGGLFGSNKDDDKNKETTEETPVKNEKDEEPAAGPESRDVPPPPPPSRVSGPITINIYPAAGQNERDLAQAVAYELEDRQRAALYD